MKNNLRVRVHSSEMLKPAIPSKRSTLYLNNIDHQVFFHVEFFLVFEAEDATEKNSAPGVCASFRHALAQLLVPYSFVAGRYRFNSNNGRLEIDCNNEGVVFTDATSEGSISELGDLRIPSPTFRRELITFPERCNDISALPLLTIQVTRFVCGGFTIGLCASHVALDGISAWKFLTDYATLVRKGQPHLIPDPDRTALLPRCPPYTTYPHPEMLKLPDRPPRIIFSPESYASELVTSQQARLCFKIFPFTSDMLTRLKKKALEGNRNLTSCSTFEALAAHIWQAKTRAMNLDPQQPSKLFIVTNTRNILKSPPFPSNFSGNAVTGASCVDITSEAICKSPLSFCVDKVHKTISSVTEEYVRSQIDWCEINRGMINIPGGTIITAWYKIPFQDLDFGWGKPKYLSPVVNDRAEFVVVMSNCKGDGGVDVFMGMTEEKMPKLVANMLL